MAEGDWIALPAAPKRAVEAVVHERSAQWRMFAYYAGFSVVAQVVTLLITWATGIEWNRALGAAVVLATLLVVWLVLRRQPDPPRALLADGSAWRVGERVRETEDVRRVVQIELPRRGDDPELWLRFGPVRPEGPLQLPRPPEPPRPRGRDRARPQPARHRPRPSARSARWGMSG
ncbi:hypothetical protein [Arenivirga flava]|uniref:Uncharacterized protein n=1 Tax=Arenivirga flava TaxID=1930060 RepID=A0AA37X9U5_9MICO|nr:hypothetical protein [Arenivirga flava]GMA28904.1 hypothetical protein GCM10025874_21570 [Arenivirga flava]